jgi:GMP synthase (glutamine-hydrolysing)
MFRVRSNLYATQFHPELDVPGVVARVRIYQHYGYFIPDTLENLIAGLERAVVTEPPRILANFVARYG